MPFTARRGARAVHDTALGHHPQMHGQPALAHDKGGSLRMSDGSWYHDPYERPEEPHHIHRVACAADCAQDHEHLATCVDHRPGSCPDSHWIGGRPEPTHPHHVECDGATGLWGYTRLTEEEMRDHQLADDHITDMEEARRRDQAERRAVRLALLQARAGQDESFAALLEHLGVELPAKRDP